jgi:hypothetical protein
MRFRKKPQPTKLLEFTEPYAFEPGLKYVIEVNLRQITMEGLAELHDWFEQQGIIVKLVGKTTTDRILNPVTATRKREHN